MYSREVEPTYKLQLFELQSSFLLRLLIYCYSFLNSNNRITDDFSKAYKKSHFLIQVLNNKKRFYNTK